MDRAGVVLLRCLPLRIQLEKPADGCTRHSHYLGNARVAGRLREAQNGLFVMAMALSPRTRAAFDLLAMLLGAFFALALAFSMLSFAPLLFLAVLTLGCAVACFFVLLDYHDAPVFPPGPLFGLFISSLTGLLLLVLFLAEEWPWFGALLGAR